MYRFASIAVFLLPLTLAAQSPAERLRGMGDAWGLSLVGSVSTTQLFQGGKVRFPVRLPAGSRFVAAALCDERCGDLDLLVFDSSGRQLAADVEPHAEPVVSFTTILPGEHDIWAVMASCRGTEPCTLAVGLFREEAAPPALGRDMTERLAAYRQELEREGFAELLPFYRGQLGLGQETGFTLTLAEAADYRFVGACDNDCGNLDLVLFDPTGREVARDRMADAIPYLRYAPVMGGDFRLVVSVVNCSRPTCNFEVLGFVRGGSVEPGGLVVTGPVISDVSRRGALEEGDRRLQGGEFFDLHSIEVRVGQVLILDLEAQGFEAFLIAKAPGGSLEQNDHFQGNPHRARVRIVAPEDGAYSVVVTSVKPGETGAYTLRVVITQSFPEGSPPPSLGSQTVPAPGPGGCPDPGPLEPGAS